MHPAPTTRRVFDKVDGKTLGRDAPSRGQRTQELCLCGALAPTPGSGNREMRDNGSELAAVRRVVGEFARQESSERHERLGGGWCEIQGPGKHPHLGQPETEGGTGNGK